MPAKLTTRVFGHLKPVTRFMASDEGSTRPLTSPWVDSPAYDARDTGHHDGALGACGVGLVADEHVRTAEAATCSRLRPVGTVTYGAYITRDVIPIVAAQPSLACPANCPAAMA